MTKTVVISGYYGFGNFGDEAILALLLQKLSLLDFEVVVLSANPRQTSMDYLVNSIFSFDFHQVAGLIKNSDILISGGGSLLQDVTSLKSLFYYLWVIFLALFYQKKIIIFAQGIGPIKNCFARFLTAKILKHCTYVSVRDARSHVLLHNLDVNSELLCDPIFSVDIKPNKKKGTIGVQLRDFATMNDNLLFKLARYIVKDFFDKKIVIYSLQNSIDFAVCEKFKNILNSLNSTIPVEIVNDASIEQIIENISGLEYMFAMRYHALVVGLKAGVKSVAINYDAKVQKLAEDAGLPIISMNASEDFDRVIYDMKHLNEAHLVEFANSHVFNWSGIEKVLND